VSSGRLTALLSLLQHTGFAVWVSKSNSIWAFPTILFFHTLGLAFVAGLSAVIALRILGVAPRILLAPLRTLFPFIWAGFCVSALSGTALFIADATAMTANPFFRSKMIFVTLAVVNMVLLRNTVLRDPLVDTHAVPVSGRILAATSMLLWLGALTAGRLIAYLGPA
jgi:hypothetical protein